MTKNHPRSQNIDFNNVVTDSEWERIKILVCLIFFVSPASKLRHLITRIFKFHQGENENEERFPTHRGNAIKVEAFKKAIYIQKSDPRNNWR